MNYYLTWLNHRSAWEAIHPNEPLATYVPENPNRVDFDWPFRGIDHVLVRCGSSGPTLRIRSCRRVFDQGRVSVSDHYGLAVEFEPPPHVQWGPIAAQWGQKWGRDGASPF